jgi:chromosome segregation ATPase
MKKDVNVGLLILVFVLAVAITSLGLYYNQHYLSLSNKYNTQLVSLQKVTQDLLYHKSRLNETASSLQLKEQDESELNLKYTEIRDTKESLEKENSLLKQEVTQKTADLLQKTNDLAEAQATISNKDLQIDSLNDDLSLLRIKVERLQDEKDEICRGNTESC